mmetsp:Transcript_57355/g.174659  ORF Transcript_57355/g.174659 Transcript_57355/m.174659 type:complete len:210 (-) Transcript_57355:542-1171(-)
MWSTHKDGPLSRTVRWRRFVDAVPHARLVGFTQLIALLGMFPPLLRQAPRHNVQTGRATRLLSIVGVHHLFTIFSSTQYFRCGRRGRNSWKFTVSPRMHSKSLCTRTTTLVDPGLNLNTYGSGCLDALVEQLDALRHWMVATATQHTAFCITRGRSIGQSSSSGRSTVPRTCGCAPSERTWGGASAFQSGTGWRIVQWYLFRIHVCLRG